MKDRGRRQKPGSVAKSRGAARHFRAMGVAVKQGKQPDERHGRGQRQPPLESDRRAQNDDR